MKNLTAIINNFKRPEYYRRCAASLRQHYPDVTILSVSDENLSRARNDGLRQAQTPYVLFCDDDMEFTPESNLQALITLMDLVDIAGGHVDGLKYEGNFHFSDEGKKVRYVPIDDSYATYNGVRFQQCDFIPNFFVGKRARLLDIEWTESIRIAWEHIDFFLEARERGIDTVYCPDACVLHDKSLPETDEYKAFRQDDAESKKQFFDRWNFDSITSMDGDVITRDGVTKAA